MRLRPFDFVAILAAATAIACTSVSAYSRKGSEVEVIISGPAGEWIYPLDAERSVEVAGALGATRIEIRGGAVHIDDSPCPTKSCVAMGAISFPGQWLACLPNEVFVRIEGGESPGEIDAGAF